MFKSLLWQHATSFRFNTYMQICNMLPENGNATPLISWGGGGESECSASCIFIVVPPFCAFLLQTVV